MPTGKKVTKEQVQFVIKNYSDMTNIELCREIGLSRSTVDRIAGDYHLRKSDSHIHLMGVKAGKASSVARGGKALNITPEVIAKRAETYKKTKELEEIRYKWGLERKTKIRLKREPRAKRDQRRFLIQRGYVIDERNLIAYWTESTLRSKRLETRKKECRFKTYYSFKPYEERLDKRCV